MFSNSQIDINAIPSLEEITLTRISKQYLKIILINKGAFFGVIFVILICAKWFIDDDEFQSLIPYAILIVTIIFLLNLSLAILAFKKRKYALRERDIIYSKGLIVNSTTTVPIKRIQHIEEVRSWLARQFGLATLKIFTAGESGSDLSIHGLPAHEAKRIHDYISDKVNGNV